jgi:fused-like protein
LCETFEQMPDFDWFSYASTTGFFKSYFECMIPDENQLSKLTELFKGERELAEERQEDLLHLGVAILAAFTYIPLNITVKAEVEKYKLSKYLANMLIIPTNMNFTENWLIFLRHPSSCINVIKALYSLCITSPNFCLFIAKRADHMNAIYDIIGEKIELPAMIVNEVIEIAIQTINTIIIQLYDMPITASASLTQVSALNINNKQNNKAELFSNELFCDDRFVNITNSCDILFNIFLQSQIASHTAAGALLFNSLLLIGCPCEVQPDTMISSALSVLTDLTQIQVKCPFNYGILDGLVLLLNQMLNQVTHLISYQFKI